MGGFPGLGWGSWRGVVGCMIPVGMIFIKLCHYLECFGWRLDFHRTLRIVKLEILELYIFFLFLCLNKFNVYTLDGVERELWKD